VLKGGGVCVCVVMMRVPFQGWDVGGGGVGLGV